MRTGLLCVVLTVAAAPLPAPAQDNDGVGTRALPLAAPQTPAAPRPPSSGGLDKSKADLARFESLRAITARHADDEPGKPESRAVAKAFVELADYYLAGIPDSPVKADPARARELLAYAASYLRDGDAQYQLGRLDLEGIGGPPNALRAARWLSLAARNEQYQAQALLGRLLFHGEGVPRQAARGLMFLMLARDAAPEDGAIGKLFDDAFKHASVDEKARALALLEDWLKGQRN
jgi:uncharacterized protein